MTSPEKPDTKTKGLSIEDMMKAEEAGTPATDPAFTGSPRGKSAWEQILSAASPDKKLETYKDHALNYDNKDSTSRIIRGSEGIIGGLDRAIVDILVGVIQKAREVWDESKDKEGKLI